MPATTATEVAADAWLTVAETVVIATADALVPSHAATAKREAGNEGRAALG